METWIYLALSAALTSSFLNLAIKDLGGRVDEYAAGFIRHIAMLPSLWILLFLFGFPQVHSIFWLFIAIMLPFEMILIHFYQKAFKISPVSLLIPIQSLSPIFIAIVSFLVFKENLTFSHFVALLFFVCGIYVLNLKSNTKHIFAPIKSLFEDKGSLYMLIVAIVLGVTVSFGKRAIVESSPQFFSAIYYSLVTLLLFPLFKIKSSLPFKEIPKHSRSILILAVLNPLSIMLVFTAFKSGPTAIVQALYSLSVFFSVILAGAFLKEQGIRKRILASTLILLGSLLIVMK